MADVKVSILEKDGVDLDVSTEYLYEDKDLPLTATTIFPTEKLKLTLERLFHSAESQNPTYTGDNITSVEFYNSATQVVGNRIMKSDLTYTSDLVTIEAWSIYDTDGITVLKTVTLTYTYVNDVVTKAETSVA
jgi:hypothetical protein